MGDAGADLYVDLGVSGEEGKGVRLRYGSGQPFQLSWGAGERGAQRLLKSSFFLLQSICGARLLLRFWWALSLAMAREMLKSRMGSEEEVDEGAVESCFLGLSWEFSSSLVSLEVVLARAGLGLSEAVSARASRLFSFRISPLVKGSGKGPRWRKKEQR